VKYPARGRNGGGSGAKGSVRLASGRELGPKGLQLVPAGDRVVVSMPGGGGMGSPTQRDAEAIRRDIRLGYITEEAAQREYGFLG